MEISEDKFLSKLCLCVTVLISMHISLYCPKPITQKLVKIVGSYSIDAFVIKKSVINGNFSCLNGHSVTVELPLY